MPRACAIFPLDFEQTRLMLAMHKVFAAALLLLAC